MFLFNLKNNLNNDSKIYNVKKKKKSLDRKTLDYKHYEMIEYFNKLECQKIDKELLLLKYQKEYEIILNEYNEIVYKIENNIFNNNELEKLQKQKGQLYLELRKKGYMMDDLKVEIKKLENSVEENEYYNRVDDILFQYYSFFENNVDISTQDDFFYNENISNSKEIKNGDNSNSDDSDMEDSLSDSDSEENDIDNNKNIKQCNLSSSVTKSTQNKPKVNNIQSKNNILYFFGFQNDENDMSNLNSNKNVVENNENELNELELTNNVIKKKKFTQKIDLHN